MKSSLSQPETSGLQTKSSKNRYQCNICSRAFSRPSHLDRHVASHGAQHQRNRVGCSRCDKRFARNDVLLRHLRAVHQVDTPTKKSTRKSCLQCVRRKSKCDRVQPCQSCINLRSDCAYYDDNTSSASCTPQELTPEQYEDVLQDTVHETIPSRTSNINPGIPLTSDPESNPDLGDVRFLRNLRPFDRSNAFQPENDNVDPYANFAGQPPSDVEESMFNSLPSDLPLAMNLGCGGLDWLDFQLQEPLLRQQSSFVPLVAPSTSNFQRFGNNATGLEPHIPRAAVSAEDRGSLTTNNSIQPPTSSQQWPFDQNREPLQPRCQLPPLRDILHWSIASSYGQNPDALEELVELLSAPYIPKLENLSYDAARLAAFYSLNEAVDRFFAEFHPILPILHIPTWNIFKYPTVLLASMACIGAMLQDGQDSVDKSRTFSDLCSRMIFWLACSDSNSYSDLSYLSASCLYQIYSLGSGNHQLYQDADRSRGSLIGSLRGMGILKSRLAIEDGDADLQPIISSNVDDLHADWIQWIAREREKRVAWASFEYDCSLATLTGRRGAVDLGEIPIRFPCPEALWEAPSAQAWRTLLSHSGSSVSVTSILERVMAGRSISNELSSWGKRLCSQIIGRLLWDMKQLEVPYLSKALRLPSLLSVQQQAKFALLEGFESLGRSIGNPVSSKELIDHNISRLILHYCNLYSSEDVMELVVFIVRNVAAAQHTKANIQLIEAAKNRLSAEFTNDASRTRRLVWHASQILAVAEQYLVSAPCEILRVFMGTIFLMAFSKYGNISPYYLQHGMEDLQCVKLDDIEHTKGPQTKSVSNWISYGGPAYITGVNDIYCETFARNVSIRTQSLLQRIQYWGLSRKFIRILQIFEAAG